MSDSASSPAATATAAATAADTAVAAPAAATKTASPKTKSIEDLPHKVFVGNLPFKATNESLRELFGATATVVEARIVTRGTRSLGYGFVAFESDADMNAAVKAMHGKDYDGRDLNVEVAQPISPENRKPRKQPAGDAPAAKPRTRKPKASAAASDESAVPRRRVDDDEDTTTAGGEGERAEPRRRTRTRTRTRKPKAAGETAADAEGDAAAAGAKPAGKSGSRRTPATPRTAVPDTRTPSETVVFVRNLPFTADDAALKAVFAEYELKSAHVVLSKQPNRSKGFGFIEFASHDDQKRALEKSASSPFVIEDRELGLAAALSEPYKEEAAPTSDEAKPAADEAASKEA